MSTNWDINFQKEPSFAVLFGRSALRIGREKLANKTENWALKRNEYPEKLFDKIENSSFVVFRCFSNDSYLLNKFLNCKQKTFCNDTQHTPHTLSFAFAFVHNFQSKYTETHKVYIKLTNNNVNSNTALETTQISIM